MVDWTDETSQALEGHRRQGSVQVGIPLDMFVLGSNALQDLFPIIARYLRVLRCLPTFGKPYLDLDRKVHHHRYHRGLPWAKAE